MRPQNCRISPWHIALLVCLVVCPILLFAAAPTPTPGSHSLVISQFYWGNGSGTTSPYATSYVEIFNAGSQAVDLQNWTLIYSSASSVTTTFGDSNKQWIGSIDPISSYCVNGCQITYSPAFAASNCTAAQAGQLTPHCVLNPGQYMLVKVKSSSTTGSAGQTFPLTPDLDLSAQGDPATTATTILSPSATGGKIALVNAHNSATTCNYVGSPVYGNVIPPSVFSPTVIDLVGYGNSATATNCWEGTSATAPSWNSTGSTDYTNGPVDLMNSTLKNRAAFVRTTGFAGPHNSATTSAWDSVNGVPLFNVTPTPCADTDNNAANFGPINVGSASIASGGTGMTSWVLHNSYQSFDVINGVQTFAATPCSGISSTPPTVTVTTDFSTFPQQAGNTANVNVTIRVAPSSNPTATFFKLSGSSSASGITGATLPGASTWTDNGWDSNGNHLYATIATVPTDNPGTYTITVKATDDAYRQGTGSATVTVESSTTPVTVTADSKTMTFGDTPAFTFTTDPSVTLANPPTCNTTAPVSDAGTYTIHCSGAADPSYTFTYVDANLTVNPLASGLVTINKSSFSYGAVAKGTGSSSQMVTLFNRSGVGITVAPSATGDFIVSGNSCTGTVAPGGTQCNVWVRFTPTALGTLTGTLTINYSGQPAPLTVSLSGSGVMQLTLSTTSMSFAPLAIGQGSSSQMVNVYNQTSSTVNAVTPSITGNFIVSGNTCTTALAPGTACNIWVRFTPQSAASLVGTLTVNADGIPAGTVALSGTGTGSVTLNKTSMVFGTITVGQGSSSQMVTLFNNSGAGITVTPSIDVADFMVSGSSCTGTVAAGGTQCNIWVRFTPKSVSDTLTGTLTINANGNPVGTVSLSGSGN
jgi:hypothetical protein